MTAASLRVDLAPRITPVVLANITTRHPYHDSHLFLEYDGPLDPFVAHPAFGNAYDWHSSVHSHWTALQLLGHPAATGAGADVIDSLRAAVERNLAAENIEAELTYLEARAAYERPYGWAWSMRLAAEARDVDLASDTRSALHRLARLLADRAVSWLHAMPGPVRHGVHGNTAFALGLMFDASRALGFDDLARAVDSRARAWFADDRDYPAMWERSANDFLSQGLVEADLMRRVLDRDAFAAWWHSFLSDGASVAAMCAVAAVPRVSDGQIVHLHGLNLSRAAALARIASLAGDATADELLARSRALYDASVAEASGPEYLSTHWLPTFAWDAATSIDGVAGA